jgi:hypothetical protein
MKKAENTVKFMQWIEQAAFRLLAEGQNPTLVDAVKLAFLDKWVQNREEVKAATADIYSLRADLAKPEKDPREGGSAIRYWGYMIFYDKSYPTFDQMVEAFDRGARRYEAAMQQPIPADWTWDYTPPDTFLARFPEQVYINGNTPGKVRFWMTAYDGKLQMNVLRAGQVISPPWYAHEAHVGYGDVSYNIARGTRVEIGRGEQRNLADYKFRCPTPAELHEYLKQGRTVKDLIRERIAYRF